MLGHELGEVLLGGHAGAVLSQQHVEVAQHLGDGGPVFVGGVFQHALHAFEALVQQLPANQVADLVVLLARLVGCPVVAVEFGHRGGGGGGQVLQRHLAHGAVEVVHVHVAGELPALGKHRVVEKLAHLVERALQVALLQQFLTPLGDAGGELVVALHAFGAAPQVLA